MIYQRWTEGDAYVIGIDHPQFLCVACDSNPKVFNNYTEIIEHLKTHHKNSQVAIDQLQKEADIVGYWTSWLTYTFWELNQKK